MTFRVRLTREAEADLDRLFHFVLERELERDGGDLSLAEQAVAEKLDPVAYAECLQQLPQDSIEAEAASDERQQKQWASPTLGR